MRNVASAFPELKIERFAVNNPLSIIRLNAFVPLATCKKAEDAVILAEILNEKYPKRVRS